MRMIRAWQRRGRSALSCFDTGNLELIWQFSYSVSKTPSMRCSGSGATGSRDLSDLDLSPYRSSLPSQSSLKGVSNPLQASSAQVFLARTASSALNAGLVTQGDGHVLFRERDALLQSASMEERSCKIYAEVSKQALYERGM